MGRPSSARRSSLKPGASSPASSSTGGSSAPSEPQSNIPVSHSNGAATVRFMKAAISAGSALAAVTGGLGYLGSHVVARMLAKGYYVRSIVPQGANVDFLLRMPGAQDRLQIIPVRDPAAEDARSAMLLAFRGVSTVVHAASFSTHGGKISKSAASKRIVDALKISLDAASTAGNVVTNFIYLSSEMTVFDPAQHPRRRTAELSEDDWFDCSKTSRESTNAFAYAHTVAELRLWARAGRGGLPFNVCSVIPSFVLGPVLSARHIASTPSLSFFTSMANGRITEAPEVPMSPVDVRDVARAITALGERPEISGRILLCAESLTSFDLIGKASKDFPQYKWPETNKKSIFRRSLGKGDPDALRELRNAEFASKGRRGRKYAFSQDRAKNELGMEFRPVPDTIRDTIISLVRHKALSDLPMKDEPS